ncbi:MAG: acyl-CoA thioesterase II [Acidimicrobiales bacterium]|nr:acyl-CoA thioesterase II [Acidimicrobiales bacterium]
MADGLSLDSLVESLRLTETGPNTYAANNAVSGHQVVFGGQLLAQSIVAGSLVDPEKSVKTLHTIFARGASPDAPLEITVEPLHSGRSFASSSVTISQGDRLCVRSSVLLSADEPDTIRHAVPAGDVPGPDQCPPMGGSGGDWEVRMVGDVDIDDPSLVGPAELDVWNRFTGGEIAPEHDQALVAFATDGFLIGTAMRPHEGVGQAQAHVTLATGVISHTITFHEPVRAGEWFRLSHTSPYAGHGRSYGRADIFNTSGDLVASFVQDAMIRRNS